MRKNRTNPCLTSQYFAVPWARHGKKENRHGKMHHPHIRLDQTLFYLWSNPIDWVVAGWRLHNRLQRMQLSRKPAGNFVSVPNGVFVLIINPKIVHCKMEIVLRWCEIQKPVSRGHSVTIRPNHHLSEAWRQPWYLSLDPNSEWKWYSTRLHFWKCCPDD